jgi:hypothetical protein
MRAEKLTSASYELINVDVEETVATPPSRTVAAMETRNTR